MGVQRVFSRRDAEGLAALFEVNITEPMSWDEILQGGRDFFGRHEDVDSHVDRPERQREDGRLRALTGNFIEVALPPDSATRRQPVRVRISRVTPDDTLGVVDGTPDWANATRSSS